jgi:hypothetical protein
VRPVDFRDCSARDGILWLEIRTVQTDYGWRTGG